MELLIINGWARTVYRPEDFAELVREYMGGDAARYFTKYYERLAAVPAQERDAVRIDLDYMQAELDEDFAAFREIQDTATVTLALRDQQRHKWPKLWDALERIVRITRRYT